MLSLSIWALVPKCPVCLAAHVALWTGLGLSLTTTTYLRWGLLALTSVMLVYLVVQRVRRGKSKNAAISVGEWKFND